MKKLLAVLLTVLMVFALVGCDSNKDDEPVIVNEPQVQEVTNNVQEEVVDNETLLETETAIEKTEEKKTVDPTIYDYWVVVYDQLGNELSRTTAHYGTTVKDPDGNDIFVNTNKYFHTVVNYGSNSNSSKPVQSTPGLYKNGVLVMSWNDIVTAYPKAFISNSIVCNDDEGGSYFDSLEGDLVIDPSITSIDNYAFYECKKLTSVTLPTGVLTIGEAAFANCTSLTSINIPSTVNSIGYYGFYGCAFSSINLPEGLTEIRCFSHCSNLTSITIPASVTKIGDSCFYFCTSLQTVTFASNSNLEHIDDSAFSDCSQLSSISLQSLSNLDRISSDAFENCTSILTLEVPDAVSIISSNAFLNVANVVYNGSADNSPWGAKAINGVPVE